MVAGGLPWCSCILYCMVYGRSKSVVNPLFVPTVSGFEGGIGYDYNDMSLKKSAKILEDCEIRALFWYRTIP